jgi:hypothetical protein
VWPSDDEAATVAQVGGATFRLNDLLDTPTDLPQARQTDLLLLRVGVYDLACQAPDFHVVVDRWPRSISYGTSKPPIGLVLWSHRRFTLKARPRKRSRQPVSITKLSQTAEL